MSVLVGGLLGLLRDTVETKNKVRTEALNVERERIAAEERKAKELAAAQIKAAELAAQASVDAAKEAAKAKEKT